MKPRKWQKVIRNIRLMFIKDRCDVRSWYLDDIEYRKPQPKENYLYVYTAGNSILQGFNSYQEDLSDLWKYLGKIKLETDDGA